MSPKVKNNRRVQTNSLRKRHGTSIMEAVCGMMMLSIILAVGFDFALLLIGYQANTSACREAARTASMTTPARFDRNGKVNLGSPLYASAWEVLEHRRKFGNCWITDPVLKTVSIDELRFNDSVAVGAPISGFVTVSSATTVTLPVAVQNLMPSKVTVQATFCYPITAVTLPSS
jgi:hypothetical protein